ncbi:MULTISPECIES: hypothetical protein [Rhodopirellula]|uniref:hypothetical protein n=1 Tax=Rhodopirellula TaxID=265488 RepID=UPI001F1874A7|nr:hypothetical protein [Rhodopirellula europaea]
MQPSYPRGHYIQQKGYVQQGYPQQQTAYPSQGQTHIHNGVQQSGYAQPYQSFRPSYPQPHLHTQTHTDYLPHTTTHTDYRQRGGHVDAVPHTTTHVDAVPHATTHVHGGHH